MRPKRRYRLPARRKVEADRLRLIVAGLEDRALKPPSGGFLSDKIQHRARDAATAERWNRVHAFDLDGAFERSKPAAGDGKSIDMAEREHPASRLKVLD